MFGLFGSKKSKINKLYKRREVLLEEAYTLAKSDRASSDSKIAEAEAILEKIKKLEKDN